MTSQTTAQKLAHSKDINALWEEVDNVQRLTDGSDLYTYPDGSQLSSSKSGVTVLEQQSNRHHVVN